MYSWIINYGDENGEEVIIRIPHAAPYLPPSRVLSITRELMRSLYVRSRTGARLTEIRRIRLIKSKTINFNVNN